MGVTIVNLCLLLVVVSIQVIQSSGYKGEQVSYDGYKVLRVVPQHFRQLRKLKSLENSMKGINFWKGATRLRHNVDIMVSPDSEAQLKRSLGSMKLTHRTMIEDVGAKIRANKRQGRPKAQRNQTGNRFFESDSETIYHDNVTDSDFFKDYRSYDKIVRRMINISFEYPNFVGLHPIGRTYERRTMYLMTIKIPSQEFKPIILIDAGHHAREWVSHSSALYIMDKLIKMRGRNADVDLILKNYVVWIVPVVNPDGYVFTHRHDRLWRKNRSFTSNPERPECFGVDLNRNYPDHWGGVGSSRDRCTENYAGPSPTSEKEVEAMKSVIDTGECAIELYLSLHSYGQFMLTPFGYTEQYPPEFLRYNRVIFRSSFFLRQKYDHYYVTGPTGKTIYVAPGGSVDYAYSKLVWYPFTIELPDEGEEGFLLSPRKIESVGEEMFDGLVEMVKQILSERPPPSPPEKKDKSDDERGFNCSRDIKRPKITDPSGDLRKLSLLKKEET